MKNNQIMICDFKIFSGRNIYSQSPVMKMIVDIGKYGNIPTKDIPGFNEKLLEAFPGLRTNYCGLGYPGGFLDRLREGTYMAHVLEHIILEMQSMTGYDVSYGKTRTIEEPSIYYLVYEYENEICGIECGKAAVFILNYILAKKDVKTDEFIEYLKKVSMETELGPSTGAIVREAKKQGIPVTRIGSGSLVRLGYGKHSRLIQASLTDATSCISADISCNKQLTKHLLREHKIPVPYGKVVYSEISALMVAEQIDAPVAIKPLDGNQGKGVHLNITGKKAVKAAFRDASKYSSGILVEECVAGSDYRLLVVGNRVCAAAKRIPACVTGDGKHTVKELVEIVNMDPNRGEKHEKPLTKIMLDETALDMLKKNGVTAETVLPAGKTVNLRENGNLSTGGTSIDCTDIVHPENADIAVRAANAIGIDIAGIDMVARDISVPITESGGAVVEVNAAPGLRMHLYPSFGKPRDVASDIINLLFPTPQSRRFPIVSVTGTNGKTTVVRLIAHTLAGAGMDVGYTNTNGTFINGQCVSRGDNSGPRSARALLSSKKIDAAVLETARGGIVREGLGYDLADVGVITNISEDHLGLDDIETLEELAHVKSLVVEAVKKEGCAVLNAADPSTAWILERVRVRPVLFGIDKREAEKFSGSDIVYAYVEDDVLRIRDGALVTDIIRTESIPITQRGLIGCNVENALAAASALYGLGVPVEAIRNGLGSFSENTGRFSMFQLGPVRIMLDYSHNPAGYRQVIDTCRKIERESLVGIIAMPGDRTDSSISDVGSQCAMAFDRIYIKEDYDPRGRRKGEVAGILHQSVLREGFDKDSVFVLADELSALEKALEDASPGDLIVLFYEEFDHLRDYLLHRGARQVPITAVRKSLNKV
jgi:cyanophycin synthetase